MKFPILTVILAALMLFGISCSKKPQSTAQPTVDIGVVDLNNGAENRVELTNGTVCIITPRSIMGGKLMLDMKIEKSGAVVSWPRAEATPDQPVSIYLDNYILKLTPHLK